jgi:hypothetical protein
MKKVLLGSARIAASRAFIPVIEETAEAGDASGVFFAHLHSLVVVEREGSWVYSFSEIIPLDDLISNVPGLRHSMEQTRELLH